MNSFFGLGPMELFLILFIALVVLGPQRLPGTIREVMKYWRYFRNLSGELTSQLGEEFKDLEDLNPQKMLEGLAKELDDEVERTQEAAGIKKTKKTTTSSTSKTSTTKTSTAKTSTTKPSTSQTSKSTTTSTKSSTTSSADKNSAATKTTSTSKSDAKSDADGEPLKSGESLVEESAAVAAGAAVGAASAAGVNETSKNGSGESATTATPPKSDSNDGVLAELERSMLPSSSEDASSNTDQSDEAPTSKSASDHATTDPKPKADSAKAGVNGATDKSEDEG